MAQHVKKTTSFAALHFSVAFGVTYAITGSWQVSGAVALIEPMVNTVAFFFHELVWSRRGATAQAAATDAHSEPRAARQAGRIVGAAV